MRKARKALPKPDGRPRSDPWHARAAVRQAKKPEKPDRKDDAELAELIKAANDDLSDTRKELFAFVAGLVFVVVTNYSITARDLLAKAPVRLPFIDLAVPLGDFFAWTPLAVLAVHVAVLLRLVRLREKLEATRNDIDKSQADEREKSLLRTVSNFFAQLILVRPEGRVRRSLLWLVYVSTAFFAPFFTLLAIAVRALPLHDVLLTFWLNLLLAADVGVAAYLFLRPRRIWGSASFIVVLAAANLILCVPDSGFDQWGRDHLWTRPIGSATYGPQRTAFWPTALLFESEVDNVTRKPWLFGLSRNIALVDDKLPVAAGAAQPSMSLRGRDLRYAIFDRSDLSGADFTAADLSRASFVAADLKGTQFGCLHPEWDKSRPDKQCTKIESAGLQGVDLRGAKFQWRDNQRQSLAGINLSGARMEGIDLRHVDLSRATLSGAKLAGAYLDYARFIGASLTAADLTGVRAGGADFSFSSMRGAHLDGADLRAATRFLAADMREISLFRTRLRGAQLGGAVLRRAQVWETELPSKEAMAWTDLDWLVVKPFDITLVQRLQRAIDDNPGLTVAAVDADVPVTPWDHGLKQLRDAARSPAQSFEYEPAWDEAKNVLGSKKYDAISYAMALTEFACLNASYVEAIAGYGPVWMYLGSDYGSWSDYGYIDTYSDFPINIIQDGRLAQLKNWPSIRNLENYAGDYDDTGASPLELFDLSRLVTALDHRPEQCPAANDVLSGVKQNLREAAARQEAERRKPACMLLRAAAEVARCMRPAANGWTNARSDADAWLRTAW